MATAALRQVASDEPVPAAGPDPALRPIDMPPVAVPPVAVRRLDLADFRCYAGTRIVCDRRPVVLVGPNGAGKTNLLEAVSLLAPGRGLRSAAGAEIARQDGDGRWAVAALVETPSGEVEIGTGRAEARTGGTAERRQVRIDGRTGRSQAELARHVAAVWLTPQMDRLFTEGPAGRRRFLDRLVFGFDPAHAGRVSAYQSAVRDRQRVLAERGQDRTWLTAIEETIAARGVAVAASRRVLVDRLDTACRAAEGPFPRAGVGLSGEVDEWLAAMPALAAEDRLREALAQARTRDAETGSTAVGPHRSDLDVVEARSGMPAARGSTGEQKALLISLTLAAAALIADERGAAPLLLLDEVAAHLDPGRRAALYEAVLASGAQAWMTGTEAGLFDPLAERAQRFRVERASVVPI